MARRTSKAPRTYDTLTEPRSPRLDVHEAITAKIISAIEAGAGTFEMPWHRPGVAFTLPINALTTKAYRGSNVLSLWIDADTKKFEHQVWATFKQWRELDGSVRKGEKGSLIVKYGEWTPKGAEAGADTRRPSQHHQDSPPHSPDNDDSDDAARRLFAKAAWVFNIDQVDLPDDARAKLIPAEQPRPDLTARLARVDRFVAATGIEIREGGQRAFYRHRDQSGEGDFIQMPPRNLFTGTATSTPTEAYYSTLLHEEIHGSGAKHRLDRQHGERFGDKAYAFEELVAELGAAFLCAHLEVTNTPRPDHAQYIQSWLDVLKGHTKAIFTAAAQATRAVDYLCGLQPLADPAPRDDETSPLRPANACAHRDTAALRDPQ
jgi:antirestriction protein ArdC